MSGKDFDLGDYVEVKDRIKLFYELYGQGRLVTDEVRVTSEPDGKPRVWVKGLAYRTPDDTLPGVGWSWMELPGTTSYTKGSELENTETSAWGRAIGALGILIDRSIASANEVKNKSSDGPPARPAPPPMPASTEPVLIGPWHGTGEVIVRKTGQSDGNLRQGPEGGYLIVAFKTTEGESIPQVLIRDPLAVDLLDTAGASLNGLVCTIEGDAYSVPFRNGDFAKPFTRVHASRITTAAWSLPAPKQTGPGLFDEATERELDAAVPV